MAKTAPEVGPAANGVNGDHRSSIRHLLREESGSPEGAASPAPRSEPAGATVRSQEHEIPEGHGGSDDERTADDPGVAIAGADELELLRVENVDLRLKIAKLEQVLKDTAGTAQYWSEQCKDNEKLLEEKSELIRQQHSKMQQLQTRPTAELPHEEELLALGEELEDARHQLQEDEKALMQQMREMEVQMSRERADLARQRNELQRLHNEIRHEIEIDSREADLRDRLQPFQRRHQELLHRKGAEPPRESAQQPLPPAAPQEAPLPSSQKSSGFFRRLLGQGGE